MQFVPPSPPRPPKVLPPLRLLRLARENLVAIWPLETFTRDFFGHTSLRQSVFVCNSPATVKLVFVGDAANFHTKSPQQCHALKPALSRVMTLVAAERAALWQSSAGSEIDVLAEYAYVPFSVGPRFCTGAAFGLTDAAPRLATIPQRFRRRLSDDWKVMPTCRLSLRPGNRLPMRLVARRTA
jgi:Cytochrome P450